LIIAATYSFNKGNEFISERYPLLLQEVSDVIRGIDAASHKLKESSEKTMRGQMLYAPALLNDAFDEMFLSQEWKKVRVPCEYPTEFYSPDYKPKPTPKRPGRPYREMDFVKNRLGVEVQFGKYSFMVYNVAAKMTIFRNLNVIDAGIEIVPVKQFADEMSSGVSYFEQFVWDLKNRGIADIDIPVLILGIDL
jgi:hypothetical protein